jgi:hypothetical protein
MQVAYYHYSVTYGYISASFFIRVINRSFLTFLLSDFHFLYRQIATAEGVIDPRLIISQYIVGTKLASLPITSPSCLTEPLSNMLIDLVEVKGQSTLGALSIIVALFAFINYVFSEISEINHSIAAFTVGQNLALVYVVMSLAVDYRLVAVLALRLVLAGHFDMILRL